MQKELEQIIKDYNLEGTRIQVGRQRIYPQREGLNATPEQLENLKAVIAGNSVKGSLRITAGDVVVAANTAGAIEKAFDSGLLPNQPKPSEVNLMQSTTEAPTIEVKSAAPAIETKAKAPVMESQTEIPLMENETEVSLMESEVEVPTIEATSSQNSFASMHTNLDEMGDNLDRMEVLIEQLDPNSNVVDAKSQFESGTQDQETSLDNVEVDTQQAQVTSTPADPTEAKQFDFPATAHSIDPAKVISNPEATLSLTSEAFEPKASEAIQTQTVLQNVAAQGTYFELLKKHPIFESLGITTYGELLMKPDSIQQLCDRKVSDIVIERGLLREKMDQLLDQGSPYIQQKREAGALSTVQKYRNDLWFDNQYQIDTHTNLSQRESYMDLSDAFYNNSPKLGDEYSDLYIKVQENPAEVRKNDIQVVLTAFRFQESPEYLEGALSESPYVQSQIKAGVPRSEMHEKYIVPIVAHYKEAFHDKISYGTPEDNLRKSVEQVSAAQEQVISNPEVAAAPTVTTPAPAEAKQFDFPATAHSIDPAKDFRDTVQRGAVTLQTHAVSARETLELAQKNLTTFAKHVKHRGFKAWAKEQIPILQNKAKELVQTQATNLAFALFNSNKDMSPHIFEILG